MRVDATHMLHKESPYIRSREEAIAYLVATFPNQSVVAKINEQGLAWVGVGPAFGIHPNGTWDGAIVELMSDEMLPE